MTRRNGAESAVSNAGLTSLIDVVFLLLFTLLTLSDAHRDRAVELVRLELAEVEPAPGSASSDAIRIVLEVTADSEVSLQGGSGELATPADLDRALARALGEAIPEDVVVEIHCDRDAPYGIALDLLQHLALRGFYDIQLIAIGTAGRPAFGVRR